MTIWHWDSNAAQQQQQQWVSMMGGMGEQQTQFWGQWREGSGQVGP